MKDRSVDPSRHERTLLLRTTSRSYIYINTYTHIIIHIYKFIHGFVLAETVVVSEVGDEDVSSVCCVVVPETVSVDVEDVLLV